MNVKSDVGFRQHHHTTKSITIPFVPKWQLKAHSCENVTDPVTFFQKMSYIGYILFRIRFHSNFFKVIGILRANFKSD